MWAKRAWAEPGKIFWDPCGFSYMGPHGMAMWDDYVGPIRDVSGLNGHGFDLGNALCVPYGEPMWADYMDPIRDVYGLRGHGQDVFNIIWDPNCFSNMGPTRDALAGRLYRPAAGYMCNWVTLCGLHSGSMRAKWLWV